MPHDLEHLINLALRVEGRLNRRCQLRLNNPFWVSPDISAPVPTNALPSDVEPMQLGTLQLDPPHRSNSAWHKDSAFVVTRRGNCRFPGPRQ